MREERPDDLWPWAWLTYSPPSLSYREKSDEWEWRREMREPARPRWFLIGMGIGLLFLLITTC